MNSAQKRNREKLADFLRAICKTGATIECLKLIWNPQNGSDRLQTQSAGLNEAAAPHVSGKIEFRPWEPSRGQHFHDRTVHIRQKYAGRSWRINVTSGIDNLMSYQKECNLFIKKLS